MYFNIFTPFSLTTPNRVKWKSIKFTTFFQVCIFTSVGLKCNAILNAMLQREGLSKPGAKYAAEEGEEKKVNIIDKISSYKKK